MDQKQVINDIDSIAAVDSDVETAVVNYGYPQPRIRAQGFDTLFTTIVGQQISVEAAAAIMKRAHTLLPELNAESVLQLSDEQMREIVNTL